LVSLEFECGWISGAYTHTLVSVNEQTVLLDGDFLLKSHTVILQVLKRVLCLVKLVCQGINRSVDLVDLSNQSENQAARNVNVCRFMPQCQNIIISIEVNMELNTIIKYCVILENIKTLDDQVDAMIS
jgi:hypothetical protein